MIDEMSSVAAIVVDADKTTEIDEQYNEPVVL
jgi:hypothetical protein